MNFSIIIPTRNRIKELQQLLQCINKLDYPKSQFEVIIIDNNSTDGTYLYLQSKKKSFKNLKVLQEFRLGPSFARNTGILAARFKTLIFIDDDCLVEPDFLNLYKKCWQRHPASRIVAGRVSIVKPNGSITFQEMKMIERYGWCFGFLNIKSSQSIDLGEFLCTANLSYRRDGKKDLLFDERLGRAAKPGQVLFAEDFELVSRTILAGEDVFFSYDLNVFNVVDQSRFNYFYILKRFWRAGLEQRIMDMILKEKFPSYDQSFSQRLFYYAKKFLRGSNELYRILNSKYDFVMAASYFLNKNYAEKLMSKD